MVLAVVPSVGLVPSLGAGLRVAAARGKRLVQLASPPLGVMPPLEVAPPLEAVPPLEVAPLLEGVGVMLLRLEAESWFSNC